MTFATLFKFNKELFKNSLSIYYCAILLKSVEKMALVIAFLLPLKIVILVSSNPPNIKILDRIEFVTEDNFLLYVASLPLICFGLFLTCFFLSSKLVKKIHIPTHFNHSDNQNSFTKRHHKLVQQSVNQCVQLGACSICTVFYGSILAYLDGTLILWQTTMLLPIVILILLLLKRGSDPIFKYLNKERIVALRVLSFTMFFMGLVIVLKDVTVNINNQVHLFWYVFIILVLRQMLSMISEVLLSFLKICDIFFAVTKNYNGKATS